MSTNNQNTQGTPQKPVQDLNQGTSNETKSPQTKSPDPKKDHKSITREIVNARPGDGVPDSAWHGHFHKSLIDSGKLEDPQEGQTPESIIKEAERKWGRPVDGEMFAEGGPYGEKKGEKEEEVKKE